MRQEVKVSTISATFETYPLNWDVVEVALAELDQDKVDVLPFTAQVSIWMQNDCMGFLLMAVIFVYSIRRIFYNRHAQHTFNMTDMGFSASVEAKYCNGPATCLQIKEAEIRKPLRKD